MRRGIFQVMEGRRVFEHLTCEENLLAGGYTRRDRSQLKASLDLVYRYFPRLRERARQQAGYLSGGEQQMLAIGRALMAKPRLMLLDEPSLGLAPLLVHEIFSIMRRINQEEGTTILLVEQNATLALEIADYGYIMEGGRVVLEGEPAVLAANEDVKEFYLGLTEVGQPQVLPRRQALQAAQALALETCCSARFLKPMFLARRTALRRGRRVSRRFRGEMVGARGFEPPTSRTRTVRSTRLSYAPN